MSPGKAPEHHAGKVVARNPKARHDFHLLDRWECGLVLTGAEIKSIRAGKASLKGAYGVVRRGELWLEGMHIAPYESAGYAPHDPLRPRKLLVHRRQLRRLIGALERRGLTLVPLELYLKDGWAKVMLALARGKKAHDRREDLKRRTEEREAARALGKR